MPLQIHITAGSRSGQRLMAQSGPVTFGREPDNTLVIDLAEVSRRHGELTPSPDGGWLLINHSPNGIRIGKKTVTTRPAPVTGETSVFVGETEIMRLSAVAPAKTAEPAGAAPAPPVQAKGGMKLWLGIVCGLSACLIVFMVVQPVFFPKEDGTPAARPEREFSPMTSRALTAMIEADPANQHQPDPVKYDENIRLAKSLYSPTNPMGRQAWLDAYKAYREAMRYNGKELSDPLDKLDYGTICAEVTKIVTTDYDAACSAFNRLDYRAASKKFAEINGYAGLRDPMFGVDFRSHILKLKGLADAKRKK